MPVPPPPGSGSQVGMRPQKTTEAPHEPSCGPVVDEIAACYSMHPYDLVMLLSGILGNIAGTQAGLVNCHDALVRPGTNLLLLDNHSAKVHALEHDLVQPLRARAALIRERAAGLSRRIADQTTFGQDANGKNNKTDGLQEPWIKEHLYDFEAKQKAIVQTKEIPSEPFEYTAMKGPFGGFKPPVPWKDSTPGINHLPTLFAERLELPLVPRLLAESFQREAFLVNPTGGIFGNGKHFSARSEQLATALTSWLQGCDMPFPPAHPSQGHGSYASARVGIWGSIDSDNVGTILNKAESQWNSVIQQCLLWSRSEPPSKTGVYSQRGNAMITYQRLLHSLIETRCHGDQRQQLRTILPFDWHSLFSRRKTWFLDSVDQASALNKPYLVRMHDLPERILWVLSLFVTGGDLMRCTAAQGKSLVQAAFDASLHALRIHTASLKRIREQSAQQMCDAVAAKLAQVLSIKGPLTFRQLQRSTDSERKAVLQPSIELLIRRGQVRRDSHQRYCFTATEKHSLTSNSLLS
jgi:hypothetical protein